MTAELLEQLVAALAEQLAPRIAAELAALRVMSGEQQQEPWHLVDVDEASQRLGRSPRWVRERVKRGELRHVRLDGGALAFRLEDLQTFADARCVPALEDEEPRLKAVGEEWWRE